MFMARLFITLGLLCLAITTNNLTGLAVNLQEVPDKTIQEATLFFRQLMLSHKNPVIVDMARENLEKLKVNKGSSLYSTTHKEITQKEVIAKETTPREITEVTLLPQYDSTYVVPAVINNKYVSTFLIDTGASYTVITPKMIETMHIKIPKDVNKIPVSTANGIVFAPVVKLDKVTIGGMTVDHVEAVITELGDEMQISGLLGMNYFKGMDLSFRQNKLVLSR
jgi:clan AA aspartic protease (TIGR02281 family)